MAAVLGRADGIGIIFVLTSFRMVSIHSIFLRFNMNFGFHIEGGGPRHLLAAHFLLAMGRNTEKSEDFLPLLQSAWSGTGGRILLRRKV